MTRNRTYAPAFQKVQAPSAEHMAWLDGIAASLPAELKGRTVQNMTTDERNAVVRHFHNVGAATYDGPRIWTAWLTKGLGA